jgi:hypothetical protein
MIDDEASVAGASPHNDLVRLSQLKAAHRENRLPTPLPRLAMVWTFI